MTTSARSLTASSRAISVPRRTWKPSSMTRGGSATPAFTAAAASIATCAGCTQSRRRSSAVYAAYMALRAVRLGSPVFPAAADNAWGSTASTRRSAMAPLRRPRRPLVDAMGAKYAAGPPSTSRRIVRARSSSVRANEGIHRPETSPRLNWLMVSTRSRRATPQRATSLRRNWSP